MTAATTMIYREDKNDEQQKKILRNITTYKTRTHIKSALIWVFAYITSHTRLFGKWWSFGTPFGCVYSICCCCRSHGCIKCCSLNQCVFCLVLGANRRTAEQLLLMLVCCNMATVWRARANAKSFYRTIYYLCLAWRWCCQMSFNYPLLNSFFMMRLICLVSFSKFYCDDALQFCWSSWAERIITHAFARQWLGHTNTIRGS